ncbi:MAG: SpoIIE family protein phosphatase [Lachnospiraceae bacterium]|nr:SpoIIE family protein phosphatase [Lachnospiraceae bacterium]
MKLVLSAFVTAGLTIVMHLIDRKGGLEKIGNKWIRELLIGILFGLAAIYATEFGSVQIGGAALNARDAAPLCAGLFFGGFAGIVAGVIGGVERFLCVYWGGAAFTQIACSVACVLAGLFSAILRKVVFDNKRPNPYYCVIIALMSETVHMFLIFATNEKELDQAFEFVRRCAPPMILVNILALFLAFFTIEIIDRGFALFKRHNRPILSHFQLGLLGLVLVSMFLTIYITFIVQTRIAEKSTARIFEANLKAAVNVIDKMYETDNSTDPKYTASTVAQGYAVGEKGELWAMGMDRIVVGSDFDGVDLTYLIGSEPEFELIETSFEGDRYYLEYIHGNGYMLMASMPAQDALYLTNVSIYITILLEILVFATLFLFITIEMKELVTKRMDEVNDNLEAITAGELDRVVNVRASSEFDILSDSINAMVNRLKELIEEAKNRVAKELEIARGIQLSSLTNDFDVSPAVDVFAKTRPAKEVGGDFYDAYKLDDTHLVALIADVSGKGIPAAMFMMRARTSIKALVQTGIPIEEAFTQANERLCRNNTNEMFVTAWMCVLDLKTGGVSFVNAGHNPPIIKRNGTFSYLQTKRNLVLAAMDGYAYKSESFSLQPGDEIFLYTDGVTEAININEELYGEDRLLVHLQETDHDISAEELCESVYRSVDEYAGEGVEQFDDITMLSLKYLKSL